MGKVLLFIFDEMTDYEITFVTHLLRTSGNKEIVTISYNDKVIKGRSELEYKPSKTIYEVMDEDVEGLIIPGGWYGETAAELIELIKDLNSKGKLIGAICGAGTVFLAKAGVLENVKYTTPATEWTEKHRQVFGENDPFPRENFLDKRVVRDGNIITATGIAFIDFTIEICDWFNLFDDEDDKLNFYKSIANIQ
ncbi:MAG: DJ-1/PfpI family protein [Clostridium sp.]